MHFYQVQYFGISIEVYKNDKRSKALTIWNFNEQSPINSIQTKNQVKEADNRQQNINIISLGIIAENGWHVFPGNNIEKADLSHLCITRLPYEKKKINKK